MTERRHLAQTVGMSDEMVRPWTAPLADWQRLQRERDGSRVEAEVFKRDAEEWLTECRRLMAARDELLSALVKAVGFHWQDVDHDAEAAQDECRALIARIKAGK